MLIREAIQIFSTGTPREDKPEYYGEIPEEKDENYEWEMK